MLLLFSIALILAISPAVIQPISCSAADDTSPTVQLSGGILQGKYLKSRDGKRYEAFLGIRFGSVAARFENSVLDTSTWEGVKKVTEFTPHCAQTFFSGDYSTGTEDCLYLNVYTPEQKVDVEKLPVAVYIHGGGFTCGSSDMSKAKYFMDEDIILVTITYRLGALGFLSTEDGLVTGNMGLRDQVTALKWVQQNIAAFGGDPEKVTIFGESAGGGSVNFLLLSPLAKGLFRNAAALSGSAINPWSYRENNFEQTVELGEKLGCNTASTEDLVKCLREIPVEQIFPAQRSLVKWHIDPIVPFQPTLEVKSDRNPTPFLDRRPIDILESGDFTRVPVLVTMTKDEGIIFHSAVIVRNEELRKDINEDWNRVAPITFMYGDEPGFSAYGNEVSEEIRQFYFGNAEISQENEQNLTNLYTDTWFLKGIHDTALHMGKHTPVYMGLYTHQRNDYSMVRYVGVNEILGVSHGDDLAQLFNEYEDGDEQNPLMVDVIEPKDVKMSKAFVKIITSFATSGTPEVALLNSPRWPPVSPAEIKSSHLNWFNIGLEPSVLINPFKARMDFWDKINKKLKQKSSKTEL